MKPTKAQILTNLNQVRKEILEAITGVSATKTAEIFLGEWSIKDVLAHLIGWDYANLEALQALRELRLPAFYAVFDKDWRTYNAHLVETYRGEDFQSLVEMAAISHKALLDALTNIPDAEFHHDFGVRFKGIIVTLARLLESEAEDERTHLKQICSFLGPSNLAESLFEQGYSCSQAVLQSFAERFDLPQEAAARLAAAFGAGISYQGMQCGAVSGALMVLGLRYGNIEARDKISKSNAYSQAQQFLRLFTEKNKTVLCRELLDCDLSQPGELESARARGLFDERCPVFVQDAVQILLSMLDENCMSQNIEGRLS